ncbi:MAG: ECF transporter S component [Methylocystaceae bacterium]
MTKIGDAALIAVTLGLLAIGLIFGSHNTNSSLGLLVTGGAIGAWLVVLRIANKRTVDARIIALVATMAAMAAMTRVAFAPIAGFKPTTFIVMITGYVGGPAIGFAVGALNGFASNFFLGQGPWTPWQMACWGLCGILAGVMGRRNDDFKMWPFVILAGAAGILFGWVMNIWHWLAFIEPHSWKTFAATYLTSLPFDLLHAAGNIVFSLLLGKPFYLVINRVYLRINNSRMPGEEFYN